ncbi:MAG: radical SAM protein [Acidobacteria bacterium]|nr:MAG: radical SAM protein [Acidobacteriota bacterium]
MKHRQASSVLNRCVQLFLIKPSNYDEQGYVVTHFRGVLPSNTLNCLAALTEDVVRKRLLGDDISVQIHLFDETVQKIPVEKICRMGHKKGEQAIVGLVGVQTNQFPRATDLARRFRAAGLTVLMGGFHVSGYLSMIPQIPPDIQELLDQGVTLVKGEVEETWDQILKDAISGQLKPLYDFVDDKPDLFTKPIPILNTRLMKRFVASNFGTIDCGRGCPFNCSFCTIINVQGRKMRVRSAETIAEAIRYNWRHNNVNFYFFTYDNFARNAQWEQIFDTLIQLREKEQIDVKFMMQVDVLCYKIRNFVDKARRAGCTKVFIGMESINPESLKDAAKTQNKAEDYVNLIRAWREAEVATHVGYILGFPHDTKESLRSDLQRLMKEIQVQQASFFILTPLPGSRDHLEMSRRGDYMDEDYNKYDSMHETMRYANFPEPGSLERLYHEAWQTFYSFENMKRILLNAAPRNYWDILKNFIWYKNAAILEQRHPMMTGFFRRKSRDAMRSGAVVPNRWPFFKMRLSEISLYLKGTIKLLWEMQELWLQTRPRSPAEEHLVQEMHRIYDSVQRRLTVAELQLAYARARNHLPTLKVPSKFSLCWQKWNLFHANRRVFTRADIDQNWLRIVQRVQRYKILGISPVQFFANLWLDFQVTVMFAYAFLTARYDEVDA